MCAGQVLGVLFVGCPLFRPWSGLSCVRIIVELMFGHIAFNELFFQSVPLFRPVGVYCAGDTLAGGQ